LVSHTPRLQAQTVSPRLRAALKIANDL
jgi:hypothetical protein